MKKLSVISFVLIFLFNITNAKDYNQIFNKANELYAKGNYSEAIENYKSIIKDGYESAEIYFNIANSYYKLKKIPESILYYERARKIAPEDEDINFNLKIANLRIVDKFEVVPKFFITEWIESIRDMYSSEGWAKILIALIWITFLSLIGFMISWNILIKRLLFFIALGSLILSLTSGFFAIQKQKNEKYQQSAIIFSPRVDVRSSPDDKSTVLFILHEGTKVELLDSVGEWTKIRIPRGDVGWIDKNAIEII
ncbi:MAG: tetratricopeptide repeat protein [Candidatus Kapabacteria bacterium]|nr:tetratricopeptide repeat protein [Candidatus Kapabacteria bacterium]